jgi:hypothetical protein
MIVKRQADSLRSGVTGAYRLALLACALTMAGCAAGGPEHGDAPREGAVASGEVTVSCVGGADQTERPCFAVALRNCRGGTAELRQIRLRTPIAATTGVDQHAAPLYQYSATYRCGGAGGGQ